MTFHQAIASESPAHSSALPLSTRHPCTPQRVASGVQSSQTARTPQRVASPPSSLRWRAPLSESHLHLALWPLIGGVLLSEPHCRRANGLLLSEQPYHHHAVSSHAVSSHAVSSHAVSSHAVSFSSRVALLSEHLAALLTGRCHCSRTWLLIHADAVCHAW